MSNVMSLNISDKVIEAAVREEVNAGIVKALGNPEILVRDAVREMTNKYVDKSTGNIISKDSYYAIPYFDWLAKDTVIKCVKEEIEKYVSENKEEFAKEIREQLEQNDFKQHVTAAFIQALVKTTESEWKMPIEVSFRQPEDEY